MKIEDNFLDQKDFDKLQTIMLEQDFAWYWNDNIDYEGQKDRYMYFHMFYYHAGPCSPHYQHLNIILEKIDPASIFRIKANSLVKTSTILENDFHVDMGFLLSAEKRKQWTTSIFYMNTNNGYTKFEDGTKVESVANRLVTFTTDIKHTGTSCTDEKRRVVINFNYFTK